MMNHKRKPASAYQHYQKLVQDFDLLEREMESHQEEQSELEAQLEQAQAKIRTSEAHDQQARQIQWEQERDRQLESFVEQRTTLEALRAQTEALEVQELRLQAEVEVLRERQQETSETEARQIHRLVHERTTLLEDELAKGKLDLDYITQIVSTKQRQEHAENSVSSMQTLVEGVQERRRHDFEVAEANFKARLRSFQLEKEALAEKAKTLRVTKQRAIHILSQNQQVAIKGFFDAPPNDQQRVQTSSSIPSLNFGEILQSLNQSGVQIEHIQKLDSGKSSGRRELAEALQDARSTLEHGNQRVGAIKKSLQDRKNEAQKLGITVELDGVKSSGYDGAWGIESYSPRQYETVYFMRGLVFSWMDIAVAEVRAQPGRELLEFEVKRWRNTNESVEQDCTRERNVRLAGQMLANLIDDVVSEIAEDIRMEFEASSHWVRDICNGAFKNVLFPEPSEKIKSKKRPNKSQPPVAVNPPAIRSSLFESSLEHLRALRNRRNDSKSTTLVHQNYLPVLQRSAVATPAVQITSPVKRAFGFFRTSRGVGSPTKKEMAFQPRGSTTAAPKPNEVPAIPLDVPISLSSTSKTALSFWMNEPHIRIRTILIPSSLGCSSCLQLSPNDDLLVCGTTEGAIVLWDLLPNQPAVLREWSPPKAERSRVTRVLLSSDAQVVIAFFRRKNVAVFSVNSNPARNSQKQKLATHSEDCFPIDIMKYKPRNLELLLQVSTADALAELSFSTEIRERAPNAVAKDPASGWPAAELSCVSFFSSFSLTGMTVNNTSILFGTSTGDLLKLNLGQNICEVQAAFDFPAPNDDESDSLNTTRIRREFFRGHQKSVLFASCIHRSSGECGKAMEILSVDQDGIVCIWEYSTTHFTGFGWFVPKVKLRLELTCFNSVELIGEVLQVDLTPDDSRLVCMVFYADPSKKEVAGKLHFLQVLTASMQLDRVQLDVDFVGGNGAPRFALTTNFLLLLANNLVHVYTLRTGKKARAPIELLTSGQQQLGFNNITCSTTSKATLDSPMKTSRRQRVDPTTITFVVSSDQHSRLLLHSFTASNPRGPENKNNGKRVR